ncbi:MAG: PhzF family phenazine biosynthesis protein [Actinomycetota bacterium]|nr:PhzF family phenazine biosynthesis protein [Actinomycetota bacterium]
MEFLQIDVFTDIAYRGNPLAVFPRAGDLNRRQMQAIAREMNLSETTFVTSAARDTYEVLIFTPQEELPFAGHPTIGTAWVLRHLGLISGDEVYQHSPAGPTPVKVRGQRLWFSRNGSASENVEDTDPNARGRIADALRLDNGAIGLEARELGRSGLLRPAYADAGVQQLMVPVRDLDALGACRPDASRLGEVSPEGAYCFTATGAGQVRSRGFFPDFGIPEDPATGSAAAALGLYLASRLGAVELSVKQGVEIGRPSLIRVEAKPGRVEVGGSCRMVLTGRLEALPE